MSQATNSERAVDSAELLAEHAMDATQNAGRKARSYVESHPLISAGVAFAAGVLLSALARR